MNEIFRKRLEEEYRSTLAAFAAGRGQRHSKLLPQASRKAVLLGLTADQFAADIDNAQSDTDDRLTMADIVGTFKSAANKYGDGATMTGGGWTMPKARPRKREKPEYDHIDLLVKLGKDCRTLDDLAATSPQPIPNDRKYSAFMQLWTMFPLGDGAPIVHIRHTPPRKQSELGVEIRHLRDWTNFDRDDLLTTGEVVSPNPHKGEAVTNAEGKQSTMVKEAYAEYPHALLEFDDLPLEKQCQFWRGWTLDAGMKPFPLVAAVYSGGKSIHGCVYVGAKTLTEYEHQREKITVYFTREHGGGLDKNALSPTQGMRLAGVMRDGDRLQRLVYLMNHAESVKLHRGTTK